MKKDLTEVMGLYNKFINFQAKKAELLAEYETICEIFNTSQEEDSDDELMCFEKKVNMPVTIVYGGDTFEAQINKLKIYYNFNEYDFIDIGFSLVLSIVTNKGIVYFDLAATEQEDELIPYLKINRRDLTFFQADAGTMKLSSRQNFQEILDICHNEVKKFNEQAQVKLINRLIKT